MCMLVASRTLKSSSSGIHPISMSVQLDVLAVSLGLIPNRQRKECEANSCLHKSVELE